MTSNATILITGATDGHGRALAEHLAADGARLLLHGRDQAKLDQSAAEIAERHGLDEAPVTVRADFADLAQVRALAEEIAGLIDRLDVLVNNAGIGFGATDQRDTSADGYELRFAVNYLASFDLTLRLLPLLHDNGDGARIVNVASIGQAPIDFDDVMLEHGYTGTRAYGQSKLALITAGFRLAQQLPAEQVTVNSLHPGTFMPTKIVREAGQDTVDSLEAGQNATHRLVTDPALDQVTGRFYNRSDVARAHESAYDAEVQRRLWQLSLDLTGTPDLTT
ncbi:MAG: SDR family NAD(P)-dependent oxidoreductase [Nocardioides sp.]|nr:SDR family NAD(P)-dependent oxidoreductase [Nocardioides sp.]